MNEPQAHPIQFPEEHRRLFEEYVAFQAKLAALYDRYYQLAPPSSFLVVDHGTHVELRRIPSNRGETGRPGAIIEDEIGGAK